MRHRRPTALAATATLALTLAPAVPAQADRATPAWVAAGYGGAVSTVDATATAVGLDVLRRGGNAVDAAIAAAATLGVTEPFSAGIGGGGFFVYYDAGTRRVETIDGREAAPAAATSTLFVDPATGRPYAFDEARFSGLSVGVPGTLQTWRAALARWGSRPLSSLLRPAADVADRGFTVDATFRSQVAANAAAFAQFPATAELYLPGGAPPAVGSVQRNPDLADTYRLIARRGVDVFYRGSVAADIVRTVQRPPAESTPDWAYPIRPGALTVGDLARYRVRLPAPTRSEYRGMQVYGMAAPSSGGTAVSEALNIIEKADGPVLHRYLEASALAFADRNRYVGDDTPRRVLRELASEGFARERACLVGDRALPKPVAPGVPDGRYAQCPAGAAPTAAPDRGTSTTNLTVADRWGNVVEYTFTIEATGGNAMVVPGRGFLLNNELTDFNFAPTQGTAADPNLPGPGKRPRSSMSPTIVLRDGRPVLALGSPGGATIITTVLQLLVNRYELGMSLPEAMAAPRASQRNSAEIETEAAFRARYGPQLEALGHRFRAADTAELGAATAIEFRRGGRMIAVAEPSRRGGGAAGVVARAGHR
ncbi:gamma-glutamyltransferase [Spirilliplanes yamanashiensis]|uniref:Glutathione hydrolase proenzyme n=1 Tax=Spirilliplanes yamanashiensis TaxID=42233 RepID=A0A8J4DL59_9ACTN|nr:gamma-glutamyltransferase [Spirilliplanes yamanashiensis]MDP9818582.1 gamma-glutamyltranspeptidase/glutathione hydrolase [Spirilliplanes yamanashiensis]GIJ05038.1 gamma-glutamyltranspeptidase [Spirilliplanes yamanashiensis]